MYADTFTLDLYCENYRFNDGVHKYNEFPHQYVTPNRTQAFKYARMDGWIINEPKRTCTCPKCNNRQKQTTIAADGAVGTLKVE